MCCRRRGCVKCRLGEERVGGAQVGLEVHRRLVGNLDGGLEDALRDGLRLRHRRRLGREEAAELVVPAVGRHFERALERWEPALHQVNVLQEDPAALLGHAREGLLRVCFLPLPHRNGVELAVGGGVAHLRAERLDVGARVDAREEDEQQRRRRRGVRKRLLDVKRCFVNILGAERRAHKGRDRGGDAIWTKSADEEKLLEGAQLGLPLARHRATLRHSRGMGKLGVR
eukprot:3595295-Pleurochrysis_carterae.AAC.5